MLHVNVMANCHHCVSAAGEPQDSEGQDQPCALSFACNFCGYRSSILAHVVEHQQIHTDERPFACHLCPAKFTEKKNLTRHLRSHTGEKPYKCSICNMAFSRSCSRQKHERNHVKGRMNRCYKSEYQEDNNEVEQEYFWKSTPWRKWIVFSVSEWKPLHPMPFRFSCKHSKLKLSLLHK